PVAREELAVQLEPDLRLDLGRDYVLVSILKCRSALRSIGRRRSGGHGGPTVPRSSARSGGERMRFVKMLALILTVVLLSAPVARAQEVTLSVAISLKDAIEELGRGFTAAHPGVTLRYNFGASGDLQKQIEAGARVDVFLSAAQRQMDELEKKSLIVVATRRAFARNMLTVVKPTDSRVDIAKAADLLEATVGKIAVGSPKSVPAGQYAEESLRALGLWDRLQPKLVFAENVRQVLDYGARGEVDAGFVYTTDAATRMQGVKEAFRPADDTYRPVIYPGAGVAASKQPALGRAFLDLLESPQGRTVLSRFGFQPPPAGARWVSRPRPESGVDDPRGRGSLDRRPARRPRRRHSRARRARRPGRDPPPLRPRSPGGCARRGLDLRRSALHRPHRRGGGGDHGGLGRARLLPRVGAGGVLVRASARLGSGRPRP